MNSYWTKQELERTARNYAKGKGKLKQWVLRISGLPTTVALLVDIELKDGFTIQESIVL